MSMRDEPTELTSRPIDPVIDDPVIDRVIDDVARAVTTAPVPERLRSKVRRRLEPREVRWRLPLRVAVATVVVAAIAASLWVNSVRPLGRVEPAPTNVESVLIADPEPIAIVPLDQPTPLALDEIDVAPILLE
jgi:hypothetical protein